jgi:hypothetical protein
MAGMTDMEPLRIEKAIENATQGFGGHAHSELVFPEETLVRMGLKKKKKS